MHLTDCQMACIAESTQLRVCALSEEEDHAAGLLGGADHQAHEPHPERAAAREVRPGELHSLRRQVCRRVLRLQKEEDDQWGTF